MEDLIYQASPFCSLFKKRTLKLIIPHLKILFFVLNSLDLTQFTYFTCVHKVCCIFCDSLGPICDYGEATETIETFFFTSQSSCMRGSPSWKIFGKNNSSFLSMNGNSLTQLLLYGGKNMSDSNQNSFLNLVTHTKLSTKQFDNHLIHSKPLTLLINLYCDYGF